MHKLFTILLVALSTSLFAQDQIAREVLDKLSKTTKSYKNIIIDFNYKWRGRNNENAMEINETQSGIFIMKGNKFLLEMNEQIIINDGENQWV